MNADLMLSVEAVSKRYHLERRRFMSESFVGSVLAPLRRLRGPALVREEMWALRDVSFEVRRGEVLALVGRNGAGKSTLLKLLSRITEPTSGRIRLRGRLTSLLEVGAGFHPELTGRENVFLNGAILGMKTAEIQQRFDEIVAFSGVERFLDMPVKRYSSGMYARLAFSIAAHLEHELMIVDEVLSVGDAAFREQCLARIEKAAHDGRTILFVSHDLGQVRRLARRAILLESGQLAAEGTPEAVLADYLERMARAAPQRRVGSGRLEEVALESSDGRALSAVASGSACVWRVSLGAIPPEATLELELETSWGTRLATVAVKPTGPTMRLAIAALPLAPGNYRVGVVLRVDGRELERLPGGLDLLVLPPASEAPTVFGDGPIALAAQWSVIQNGRNETLDSVQVAPRLTGP